MSAADDRYQDGTYFHSNPDWHVADSPWKAAHVSRIVERHALRPESICEVGAGAGEILRQLWLADPSVRYVGYEVSPDAHALALTRSAPGLEYRLVDAARDPEHFDLMLLMDVIEHVPDPLAFLRSLRAKAERAVMHIPLELSVQAVLRPQRLLTSHVEAGHLHFFNEALALTLIREAGFSVLAAEYTFRKDPPRPSLPWRVARVPRRWLRAAGEPAAARILGGFSLLILAETAA